METVWATQMLDLTDKGFKAAIISMFRILEETMVKRIWEKYYENDSTSKNSNKNNRTFLKEQMEIRDLKNTITKWQLYVMGSTVDLRY